MIRGIVFDLDGVLVKTDELHYCSWRELTDREGIRFDRSLNERLRGLGRMESLSIILEGCGRTYTQNQKQQLAKAKNDAYLRLLNDLTPADTLPGVMELLGELRRRKLKTAVASSSRNAADVLERIGLAGTFDAVVDGNDVPKTKPHPDVYQRAAEQLGLPPAECLAIEDAPAGVESAKRAGMSVLGVGTRDTLPDVEWLTPGLDCVTVDELVA